MAQLEVIVNKLNRRKSPVADFTDKSNVVNVLPKGHVFEAVGEITNVLGKWYLDKDGYYSWEEGLTQKSEAKNINSWFDDFKIKEFWDETKGGNVNIAMLDSGIDTANKFLNKKIDFASSKNYWNSNVNISDEYYHGTHCASLIISDEFESFCGIAPEARISVLKVVRKGSISMEVIIDALNDIITNPDIDVISVSLQIEVNNATLNSLFEKAVNEHNKIIVCSIGNNGNKIPIIQDVYPAKLSLSLPIISVGALNKTKDFSNINYLFPATICFPGEDVYSFNLNQKLISESGSSQACAAVAGLICLIVSLLKKKGIIPSPKMVKDYILSAIKSDKSEAYNFNYNKLDVYLLFQLLKSI